MRILHRGLVFFFLASSFSLFICPALWAQPDVATRDYATSDLQGTWYAHILSSSDSPGYTRATHTINSSGEVNSVLSQPDGDTHYDSNTASIASDGTVVLSGVNSHFFLNEAKNLLIGVGKDQDSEQDPWLHVAVKQSSSYSTSDLTGSWQTFSLSIASNGETDWEHGTLTVSPGGAFTHNWNNTDIGTGTSSGSLTLSSKGEVGVSGFTWLKGNMNSDKTFVAMTGSEGGSYTLLVFVKQEAVAFSQSDLTGSWQHYSLRTGGFYGWVRSTISVDSNGMAAFYSLDSLGYTYTSSSGPLTLNPSGSLSMEGQPVASLMSSDKGLLSLVKTRGDEYELTFLLKKQLSTHRFVTGTVTYNGAPVEAMVLVNGQYMFTSGQDGKYTLYVPLGEKGQITVQCFCSVLAPYKQSITPTEDVSSVDIALTREERPDISVESLQVTRTSSTHARVQGVLKFKGSPVNAMALANGKYMFTSVESGAFDLDVALNPQGKVTLMCFCSGLRPYRQTLTPQ